MKIAVPDERLTLTIELADGSVLPVTLQSDSIGFIGHYARLPAFGQRDTMLKFHLLPAR
ncbi:hypothetical protein LWE61_00545 [Sphingobium sufflavum]|uniref:hypothetical protein n=1 Tax=Sphingobium sufflavum TaxID=1129547 RepID=UPI001F423986|nr:hypothetical protein [Sphingobium sufflavum]MCE7795037.1 hypothetical protein [Sphingobium sufflavum]